MEFDSDESFQEVEDDFDEDEIGEEDFNATLASVKKHQGNKESEVLNSNL